MPYFTATYDEFCDMTGLSRSNKEVSSDQFDARTHIAEKWLTKLVSLNSVDVDTDQEIMNSLGSLVILRHVMVTPDLSIVDRAGGGAGSVISQLKNQVNQTIDELLDSMDWTMNSTTGLTYEFEN